MKLWGGRFNKDTNKLVEEFTASIQFDQVLAQFDIAGSRAHVKMLKRCKILTADEASKILTGLNVIEQKITHDDVEFSIADEDIHMNIERLLFAEIGELAGKIHTGRSRNDQVALDMHLFMRHQVITTVQLILELQQALFHQAQTHIDTLLPGYTHLQRAQPIRLAHHLLAYCAMLQRDAERFIASWPRINTMPLGAGALAGAGFAFDRDYVAAQLNFDSLYENSLDAVSDRDFVLEYIANASMTMMHLSRLSEELILWSSQEFSFIELDDAYCTGSSMMPQKKNPDVAELIRGKTGRVYGALIANLTMLKGLPLAYNKDMQEDKEGVFDVVETLNISLQLYAPMIATMKINTANMLNAVKQDYSNATQLADYLVNQNIPFREAHAIVGKLVMHCISNNTLLADLPLEQYQQFSETFSDDIYTLLIPENVVDARCVRGGTAKTAVQEQISHVVHKLKLTQQWLDQIKSMI